MYRSLVTASLFQRWFPSLYLAQTYNWSIIRNLSTHPKRITTVVVLILGLNEAYMTLSRYACTKRLLKAMLSPIRCKRVYQCYSEWLSHPLLLQPQVHRPLWQDKVMHVWQSNHRIFLRRLMRIIVNLMVMYRQSHLLSDRSIVN